jgi:hypothetical protein
MSDHYTLLISLELDLALAAEQALALDFVFNGTANAAPPQYPAHPFFNSFLPEFRFHRSYRDMPAGSWMSGFWSRYQEGALSGAGVNLTLPGYKMESVYGEVLMMAAWLASLSARDGCIGLVRAEDGATEEEPMAFFARSGKLYIGKASADGAGEYA